MVLLSLLLLLFEKKDLVAQLSGKITERFFLFPREDKESIIKKSQLCRKKLDNQSNNKETQSS